MITFMQSHLSRSMRSLLVLAFVSLLSSTTPAATFDFEQASGRLKELTTQKKYNDALRYGYHALDQATRQYGSKHEYVKKLRNRLANLYEVDTMLDKVPHNILLEFETHLRQALQFYEHSVFKDTTLIAMTTNNLAYLLKVVDKKEQAIHFYSKAIDLYKALGADQLNNLAYACYHLADLYTRLGQTQSAIDYYKKSLTAFNAASKPGSKRIDVINTLAKLYIDQENFTAAEKLYLDAIAIQKDKQGEVHENIGTLLIYLARLYKNNGHYDKAVKAMQRAVEIYENVYSKAHKYTAHAQTELARLHIDQQHYAAAHPLLLQALETKQSLSDKDTADIAVSMDLLAISLFQLGQYGKAEPVQKQALEIWEQVKGNGHPDTLNSLERLAKIHRYRGNYTQAQHVLNSILPLRKKFSGAVSAAVADILDNLGLVYHHQGNYTQAETSHKQALEMREKIFKESHPDIATSLVNLAGLYNDQGRYYEAEPLLKRAVVIFEKHHGLEDPRVATSLNNLSNVYRLQGRLNEAVDLQRRILVMRKKAFGDHHPQIAVSLNNIGVLLENQGQYNEAETQHLQALVIREKSLGKDHPLVATTLTNLASIYDRLARHTEALLLYIRALSIKESSVGKQHPEIALILVKIAGLYVEQRKYDKAEPLYLRALAIREKTLGKQHPEVTHSLNNLAVLYDIQDRFELALQYSRKASRIFQQRFLRQQSIRSSGHTYERQSVRTLFLNHIGVLERYLHDKPDAARASSAEALHISQLARTTATAQALAQMAARFAAGGDRLALRVREHQDALKQWQHLDMQLTDAYSAAVDQRQPQQEQRLRQQLADLDQHLLELDASLARDFPAYTTLTNPAPLSLQEVQELLKADEAILSYLVDQQGSFLFVIRRQHIALHRIATTKTVLDNAVRTLRKGLDSENMLDDSASAQPGQEYHELPPYRIPRFDTALSHQLYQQLVAPAEPLLAGTKHIMIIADGALTSLPFGVLVTEKPATPVKRLRQYKHVPWLTKQYALSTLPSISALRVLRHFAKRSRAEQPLVGFGDPLLGDTTASDLETRGRSALSLLKRGPIADADTVRKAFVRLPDTRYELQAIADTMNSQYSSLYLQERATETRVRSMSLSPYRVLAFATHGLMAGEFQGVAEAALVLTPPKLASKADDGLLTAGEVAQLQLNADWVILSACNTAAADGSPGAQGLSGLARAFFYAGSRALLVSHWYVVSDSTVQLQTGLFKALAAQPGIGRAEALRQSRLQLMKQRRKPYFAHPMFWAPFVVVGEGAAE